MNRGPRALTLRTNGQVMGWLVDPRAREVAGGFAGAMTLPGVAFRAPPGEAVNIPLLVGTDSFRGTLGYAAHDEHRRFGYDGQTGPRGAVGHDRTVAV
jgi:hypothetical protein